MGNFVSTVVTSTSTLPTTGHGYCIHMDIHTYTLLGVVAELSISLSVTVCQVHNKKESGDKSHINVAEILVLITH